MNDWVTTLIDDIFLDLSEKFNLQKADKSNLIIDITDESITYLDDLSDYKEVYKVLTSKNGVNEDGWFITYTDNRVYKMIIKYKKNKKFDVSEFKTKLEKFKFSIIKIDNINTSKYSLYNGVYIEFVPNKQNESVLRSPKWLRDYLDFEVRTGGDIKGDKSKRQLRRDQEEEESVNRRKWNVAWDRMDDDPDLRYQFKSFIVKTYPKYIGVTYLSSSDMESFKRQNRGDNTVWSKFDAFLKKEEESKKFGVFIDELIEEMEYDWKMNGDNYDDRIVDNMIGNVRVFTYTFAKRNKVNSGCGRDVTMSFKKDSKGEYSGNSSIELRFEIFDKYLNKNSVYNLTMTGLLVNRFIKFVNLVTNSPSRGRKYSNSGYSSNSNSSGSKKTTSKEKYDTPKTGNRDRDRYNLLNDKYKLRKEQLDKMKKTDPSYDSLKNELDNYKRAIDRMKSLHKFENLKSWGEFTRL